MNWRLSIGSLAFGAALFLSANDASAQAKGPAPAPSPPVTGAPTGTSTQAGWLKSTGNECISSEAKKALSACPGGSLKKSSGKKSGPNFVEQDVQQKKADKHVDKPVAIDIPRPSPELSKKLETSLMQEIVQLEKQLEKTKASSDKHVTLARRLAESWYELERIKQGEALDLTTKILEGEKKKANVADLKAQRTKAETLRDKSQIRVVELYKMIIEKHEDYQKLDEVLYYLAYEYEQQKATDPNDKAQVKKERESKEKALAAYLDLIKKRPKSKYVSAAYIAYGDLYFEDALNGKIDWKIPLEAYDRVIASGEPPENKQYGYAYYKKGFIYWNQGNYKEAVTSFKKAIDFGQKYPDLPKAPQIAEEARKELIPVYAEYGKAEEAYGFFNSISGDKSGDKTKVIGYLEKLGEEYLARAHPEEARKLFLELKGHNPPNACFYETRITEAVINKSAKDKPAIKTQLTQLVKTWIAYRDGPAPADKKQSCGNQTAWLLAEHALAWTYEAMGDLGCPPDPDKKAANPKARPGTCNKDTLAHAIGAFELIIGNPAGSQPATFKTFDGYKFNTKRPEDSPTIPKLKYAYADILYGQQMWEKCGPAFDEVVALDPNSDVAGDAAFAAVLCYQNMYDKEYKAKDKQENSKGKGTVGGKEKGVDEGVKKANAPKEMTAYQAKMVGAFDRFICYVKPDAASKSYKEDSEKMIEIKHRRGFLYYDSQHWDEAAEAFKEVAVGYPEHEYGIVDAGFYLDAVVRIYLYADPPRANCGTQMGDEVTTMINLYCDKEKVGARLKDKKRTEEFLNTTGGMCDRMLAARADLEAIRAQDLAKAEKFEEAGDKFLKLADDVCTGSLAQAELDKKATEGHKKPGKGAKKVEEASACDERGDVYLYNAAINYQRASKIKRAMDIRQGRILKKDAWKAKETYRLTMKDLADDYRRIALYGFAAEWYEKFAQADANITKYLELVQNTKSFQEQVAKGGGKKPEEVAKDYVDEERASALSNAVLLRLGLGQEEEAIKDSETFDKKFGAKRKDQARQIFLAIGEHYIEQAEWKKGFDRIEKFIKNYDSTARIDEKYHTRAMAGRAARALKQNAVAEKYFGEIRADWGKDRGTKRKELEDYAAKNPGAAYSARTNTYGAVAEALLFFADKDYEKANALKFEAFKGGGDEKAWTDYFTKTFGPYIKKRIELNQPAYEAYVKVFCLGEKIDPSECTREWKDLGEAYASKFVVEAASKAGDLYADTYDKAYNAPLGPSLTEQPGDAPNIKKEKGILRRLFYNKLDQVAQPIIQPARTAFKECLEVSTRAQFFDEYSERCEKWLAKKFKNEYRTLAEVRPSAGLVGSGIKDRAFLVDSKLVPFDVAGRK